MERAIKMSNKESSVNTPSIESKETAQNIVTTPIEKETAGSVEAKEAQNKFSKLEDLNEVRLKNNPSKELKINHDPNHADNMHKF